MRHELLGKHSNVENKIHSCHQTHELSQEEHKHIITRQTCKNRDQWVNIGHLHQIVRFLGHVGQHQVQSHISNAHIQHHKDYGTLKNVRNSEAHQEAFKENHHNREKVEKRV
jgi:hypothetical protein